MLNKPMSSNRTTVPAIGTRFDTEYEQGCIVTSGALAPGYAGFLALDSDGVECEFDASMIVRTY